MLVNDEDIAPATERMYHVVSIRNDSGKKTYMTSIPVNAKDANTIKNRLTAFSFRRLEIENA